MALFGYTPSSLDWIHLLALCSSKASVTPDPQTAALVGLSGTWPFESSLPCSPSLKGFDRSVPSRLSTTSKLSEKDMPTAATENAIPLNNFVNIGNLVP